MSLEVLKQESGGGLEAVAPVVSPLTVQHLTSQVGLIQEAMRQVMVETEDYGTVPGCGKKPTLLQPGAQKLGFMFQFSAEYAHERKDLPGGHLEFTVTCTLRHRNTGKLVGQGLGMASSMESKWRFRTGPKEDTGQPVPKDYWDARGSDPVGAQALIGGKGYTVAKDENGQWTIHKQGEKAENPNPADVCNTVLKMAAKRAYVGAVLTATGASFLFTQDIEDLRENLEAQAATEPAATPAPAQAPQQPARPAPSFHQPQKPQTPPPTAQPQQGASHGTFGVLEVKVVNSKPGVGKPWTAHFLECEDENGEPFEVGTFDNKLGEAALRLKGQIVEIEYKPSAKKPGKFELVSIKEQEVGVTP